MGRTEADVEAFFNDLDTDEIAELIQLVDSLDPLEMEGGEPKYTADQINLIQRFQQFVVDHPAEHAGAFDVEADEDGLEREVGDNPDEDGDIPGTGEDVADEQPAGSGGLATQDVHSHNI